MTDASAVRKWVDANSAQAARKCLHASIAAQLAKNVLDLLIGVDLRVCDGLERLLHHRDLFVELANPALQEADFAVAGVAALRHETVPLQGNKL